MAKITNFLLILLSICYSLPINAGSTKPINCKDFPGISEIKKIISIDKGFHWDAPNCKIVATKSIFPRQNHNGIMKFGKGLQLFLYDDYQLKFICLPGWVCKQWN